MTDAPVILLLAGAADQLGVRMAQDVLRAGGRVAAAVSRAWQVEKLRDQLLQPGVQSDALLIGVVAGRDAEAAAGFVKGATDALGAITHLAGASFLLRQRRPQREPAGDLDEMLDANLHTNVTLARAVLPSMRRRRSGRLIFLNQPAEAEELSVTCLASFAAMAAFADALALDCGAAALQIESIPAPSDESLTQDWMSVLHDDTGQS